MAEAQLGVEVFFEVRTRSASPETRNFLSFRLTRETSAIRAALTLCRPARLNENRDWSRCTDADRSATYHEERVSESQSLGTVKGTIIFSLFPYCPMGFMSWLCADRTISRMFTVSEPLGWPECNNNNATSLCGEKKFFFYYLSQYTRIDQR